MIGVDSCPPIPLALARLPFARAGDCQGCGGEARWAGGALHRGRIVVVQLCDDCAARFDAGEGIPRVRFPTATWMTVHELASLLGISTRGVTAWVRRHKVERRMIYPGDGGGCSSYYARAAVFAVLRRLAQGVPPWRQGDVLRERLGNDWQRWISSSEARELLGTTQAAFKVWVRRVGLVTRNLHFGKYGRQGFYDRAAIEAELQRRRGGMMKVDAMRRLYEARAAAAGPEWMPMWEARELLGYQPGEGLRIWARRNNVARRAGLILRAPVLAEASRRKECRHA